MSRGIKGWKEKKSDNKCVRREPNEGPALGIVRKSREGGRKHCTHPQIGNLPFLLGILESNTLEALVYSLSHTLFY